MNIVIVGHVDHGKSTLVGRLLFETNSISDGKIEYLKRLCEYNSKPFEYAFLIDALKEEQSQGITIDTARVFFKTKKRQYLIFDTPGHIEFLKNMITGAARAEAAFLLIDASEGVQENSRRHGFLISLLGIKQVIVVINKMDLVNYDKNIFESIKKEYSLFLQKINILPLDYIPISAMEGENVSSCSKKMNWYNGKNLLELLDNLNEENLQVDKPFRLFVQDVYKFTKFGDSRRIIAGNITSGVLRNNDEVIFYPSGKKSKIKNIEAFNEEKSEMANAGKSIGFTLFDQIYIKRGDIVVKKAEIPPKVAIRIKANIFWLDDEPLQLKSKLIIKIGTNKINVIVQEISKVIDSSKIETIKSEVVNKNNVAECIFQFDRSVACDTHDDDQYLGRFVLQHDYKICGGGIVLEVLNDETQWIRNKVITRNMKWEKSRITVEERIEKFNQRPHIMIISGKKDTGKKEIAKELENKLFLNGRFVYFLGIGNVLYSVDADIKEGNKNREEHLRRLSEVANILFDAGIILIITAIEIDNNDLKIIETVLSGDNYSLIRIGEDYNANVKFDLIIDKKLSTNESIELILSYLKSKDIIR